MALEIYVNLLVCVVLLLVPGPNWFIVSCPRVLLSKVPVVSVRVRVIQSHPNCKKLTSQRGPGLTLTLTTGTSDKWTLGQLGGHHQIDHKLMHMSNKLVVVDPVGS